MGIHADIPIYVQIEKEILRNQVHVSQWPVCGYVPSLKNIEIILVAPRSVSFRDGNDSQVIVCYFNNKIL